MAKFYITTTLPYINAEPHLGFALEIVRADALARAHRLAGDEVFFNTGVDEHGLKVWRKARELKMEPQDYCDQLALSFSNLKDLLNLSWDNFIRTTDPHHEAATQEFWRRCAANGDIYKQHYQVKYCVGCEMEKTESELVNGFCPLHPGQELELIDEENYFFRLSRYQNRLLELYNTRADFVLPAARLQEIKSFTLRGLQDFSISRLSSKLPWGVPVPGDSSQVMYVWFDALVNYISALGWPEDSDNFSAWWPGVQIAGKDNLRPQALMWQAMLMSAGLEPSRQIFIDGFITAGGQKMSKSLGNIIGPQELTKYFGIDAVRYYLLAQVNDNDDGDYSPERFKEVYEADLANGLGNLFSRLGNLAWRHNLAPVYPRKDNELYNKVIQLLYNWHFNQAIGEIWSKFRELDKILTQEEPWKMKAEEAQACLKPLIQQLVDASYCLTIFLPQSAAKILDFFSHTAHDKPEPLFPRLNYL